jgi:two-component system, LytTR family, response regulator
MPIKTLVIDDEMAARKTLRSLAREYTPELEVIGDVDSIAAAINFIHQEPPDLIFLDMQLRQESGLTLLERLKHFDFEVVITTAHSEFAVLSFDFGVIDYLLKPLTPSLLRRAVSRVKERIEHKRLVTVEKESEKGKEYTLLINTVDSSRTIDTRNIIRIEADRNYSWVHVRGELPFIHSKSLSHFEKQLEPAGFLRVHHSHLINPSSIKGYNKNSTELLLEDRSLIPISREKRKYLASNIPAI